jgi:hypothetical protein
MFIVAVLVLIAFVFVAVSALAVRFGVDSRPGFAGSIDWRRLDD